MATGLDYVRQSNRQNYTAEPADKATQSWLDEEWGRDEERYKDYKLHEEFYRGEHNTRLTDRAKTYLERNNVEFRENFCEPVVDIMSERMKITGFNVEEEQHVPGEYKPGELPEPEDKPVETAMTVGEWCMDLWTDQLMDDEQATVHTNLFIKGDSFVMLDWEYEDDEDEQGYPCIKYNRPELFKCTYKPTSNRELEHVTKGWIDRMELAPHVYMQIHRINCYFPDRIEKYWRAASAEKGGNQGWMKWTNDNEPWPLPWVDAEQKPLGIPIFHFKHKALGNTHGYSELANVVPQNESLNKLVIDLNVICDSQAWRQRWATGIDPDTANGYKHVPGEIWSHTNSEAKFGDFEADDPAMMVAAIENTISRIARRTRTPLHLLTGGDMPSGESLRAAEAGLVAKIEAAETSAGDVWNQVMLAAMQLSVARGVALEFEIPDRIDVEWKDPESRMELEHLQSMVIKQQLGVSKETLLTELGYNAMAEMKAAGAEREAQLEQDAKFFDEGGGAGGFGKGKDEEDE